MFERKLRVKYILEAYVLKFGKGGFVVIAGTPKKDKQLLAQKIWLLYYNDVLYRSGVITTDAYHKMIHKINNRAKTTEEQKNKHSV